jgi:hypothetical protein
MHAAHVRGLPASQRFFRVALAGRAAFLLSALRSLRPAVADATKFRYDFDDFSHRNAAAAVRVSVALLAAGDFDLFVGTINP